MYRILIVSDSHGKFQNLEKVLKRINQFDYMIHLGDSQCSNRDLEKLVSCPVHVVRGNCDYSSENPVYKIIEIGGNRIFITHGHTYHVQYTLTNLLNAAREQDCSIAMFGHTHVPYLDKQENDVTILNPGSISRPRQGDHRPSYMIMEIADDGKPYFLQAYLDNAGYIY